MSRSFAGAMAAGFLVATSLTTLAPTAARAEQPGRGLTARFEVEFMKLAIDHHFAAMRMTELAVGTDPTRNAGLAPGEGTSPTPGFDASPAKASLDDLKSLARRNNRMQREEILTLQGYLRDWYRIGYEPKVRPESRPLIAALEGASRGREFDHAFFETFSRHHFSLLAPINGCLTGSELRHDELRRLCTGMWHSQSADIDEMRQELLRHFGIADYRPFRDNEPLTPAAAPPRGQHGGDQP